jgi:hypothetical protein
VTEGRIDGNFSPGLRHDMISAPYGFRSGVSGTSGLLGTSMTGFTIDGESFGNFEYGLTGRPNMVTIGTPDVNSACIPGQAQGNYGTSHYSWQIVGWFPTGTVTTQPGYGPCTIFSLCPSCSGLGCISANSFSPTYGWVYTGNDQAEWECETNPSGIPYQGGLRYVDLWRAMTLEIVLDGNLYTYDLGPMFADRDYLWTEADGIVGGIRIEYKGVEYKTADKIEYGSSPYTEAVPTTTTTPTCIYCPQWQVSTNAPSTLGSGSYVGQLATAGNNGPEGYYTYDINGAYDPTNANNLIILVYFDEAFGQIPPGSSLEIITDPSGQHLLAYRLNTPYGNSGLISGDPYLDKYDEPNAKIRFRDSSIVEGGISTFMKTFDYQSGVGGCKDC